MEKQIEIKIDTSTLEGYKTFLKCKKLPLYKVKGNVVVTDERSYSYVFTETNFNKAKLNQELVKHLFDYQKYLSDIALERKKYSVNARMGLGKTRIQISFANSIDGKVLYMCPLAVMGDIQDECERMGVPFSNIRKGKWEEKIGLINYEMMRDIDLTGVRGIVLDESSILKNSDGQTRKYLTELAANMEYRMSSSGTPSPNDTSEYATQAVFLGISSTVKEFYSRFFYKEGVDWYLKPHAKEKFYDFLSSWACYLNKPSALGFEHGAELDEEPDYITIPSRDEKYIETDSIFGTDVGLKDGKRVFGDLRSDPDTERFSNSIEAIKGQHSIIWCSRNAEEMLYHRTLKGKSELVTGATPIEKRVEIINEFRKGNIQYLISKPKILGWGVNLQQAESMLFSGYTHSFESFYQAVHRSHRYGRQGRLKVYIPLSECETPVWDSLNQKLDTFQRDCDELQKRFFKKLVKEN